MRRARGTGTPARPPSPPDQSLRTSPQFYSLLISPAQPRHSSVLPPPIDDLLFARSFPTLNRSPRHGPLRAISCDRPFPQISAGRCGDGGQIEPDWGIWRPPYMSLSRLAGFAAIPPGITTYGDRIGTRPPIRPFSRLFSSITPSSARLYGQNRPEMTQKRRQAHLLQGLTAWF